MLRIVLARTVVFAYCCGGVQAQNAAQAQPANGKGPKTLLEAVLGWRAPETGQEEDRLEPDRPHFPEAATTVGKGRAVVEAGYTVSKNGTSLTHSFPESLLRVGMLAEWFEFRIGQSALVQRQISDGGAAHIGGVLDLYLGCKFALMAQQGVLPAIAVIPQMTVPTVGPEATTGRVLPGVNVNLSWEVIKGVFSVELLIANNFVRDEMRGARHELGTGLTVAFQLTKKLEAFVEWDAFYPSNGPGSSGPRHYAVGGLVYFVTSNFAVDVRAGVGLNDAADDFITGVGFAVRF